jgi:hypothetical protein
MAYATIMSEFWDPTFLIEPRPVTNDALSTLLIVSSDSTLNGDRYRLYADLAEVQADVTATYVSATALAYATAVFAQSPAPNLIAIGRRDTSGGGESFATALGAIATAGLQFGLVVPDSTTAAQATSVASYTDGQPMIALVLSADGGWITNTIPAGFPTSSTSLGVIYHPTAGQDAHAAIMGRAAGQPADTSRPDFTAPVAGITLYNLTPAQQAFAAGHNCNTLRPLQSGGTVPYPPISGCVSLDGENLYTRFTVMFYTYRWRDAIASQYAAFAAQNKVWPYNDAGKAALAGCLQPAIDTGLAVGYLTRTVDLPNGYTISYSLAGGVITATVRLGLLDGTEQIITVTYVERAA